MKIWRHGALQECSVNNAENDARKPVGSDNPDRLYRSCQSVEAASASSWGDFEAYPAVCPCPTRCDRWQSCWRLLEREQVLFTARVLAQSVKTRLSGR